MVTQRQKTILDGLIREYVATAAPVASAELVKKYRLPYSSATVRNELFELDKAGFLIQPHTSAGRVPTDKGYRFFINRLAPGNGVREREERTLRQISRLSDPADFLKQSARFFAQFTRSFVLAGFPEEEIFYKAGFQEVIREPEFSDLEFIQEFSALLDMLEDEVEECFDLGQFDEPQTFIGQENPIRQARRYAMIVSRYPTPFAKEGVVALLGPKRMDYGHHLALIRHFRQALVT